MMMVIFANFCNFSSFLTMLMAKKELKSAISDNECCVFVMVQGYSLMDVFLYLFLLYFFLVTMSALQNTFFFFCDLSSRTYFL